MEVPMPRGRARITEKSLELPGGSSLALFDVLLEVAPGRWHPSSEGDRTFRTRAEALAWLAERGLEEV